MDSHQRFTAFWVVNSLTLFRLLSVPCILWCLYRQEPLWVWAFGGMLGAALSDWADGFLARMFNVETALGAALDPVADKLMGIGLFFFFAWRGSISWWLMVGMISRDVLIVLGYFFLKIYKNLDKPRPLGWGKGYTAVQFGALLTLTAQQCWPAWFGTTVMQIMVGPLLDAALWAMIILSTAAYIIWGIRQCKIS